MRPPRQYGPTWLAAELLAWLTFPVGLLWLLLDRVARWSGRSPDERAARMLRWYPPEWRDRYGHEFEALLRDAAADGHDGLRLWLDVAREAAAVRIGSARPAWRDWGAAALWTVGVIAVLPQGIVALLIGGDASDSWFLVMQVAPGARWAVAAGVIAGGLLLMAVSLRVFVGGGARAVRGRSGVGAR